MGEGSLGGSMMPLIEAVVSLEEMRKLQLRSFDPLTTRERQVLPKVAEGMSDPVIAQNLGISRVTVQNHSASINRNWASILKPFNLSTLWRTA